MKHPGSLKLRSEQSVPTPFLCGSVLVMDRVMALGRRRPNTRAESMPALSGLRSMLTVGTAGNESAAAAQRQAAAVCHKPPAVRPHNVAALCVLSCLPPHACCCPACVMLRCCVAVCV